MAWFAAQGVKTEHRVSCAFGFGIFVSIPEPLLQRRGALVPVGVCVRAGHGVVDPVQDDEGHAADHDQEAEEQEGGGLERRQVCLEMVAFYADDGDMCVACCLAPPRSK